ncbi:5988_t:CDS:2 [Entrophospora sp. SA101]|nr:5988_t:CDS:2 [Entrophospora sp. SA101]
MVDVVISVSAKRHDDYDNVNLRGKQEGMKTILAYSEERSSLGGRSSSLGVGSSLGLSLGVGSSSAGKATTHVLKSLHLDYCCDGHTLDCISKNCRTIEELWISLAERTIEIKPLCDLITSQKSLKDFRIRSSTMIMEYYFNIPDVLLEALETHKDSLTTLQFFCCQFYQCQSFKPISECKNLKRLGFFNCEGMTHSKIFHLAAKGNLPKLEVLAIAVYDEFSSDVIIGMIKNSHNTLKRVSLPMATPDNGINHVMNAMKSFCYENLRGITVNFMAGDHNNFENFLSLLEKCQNLERICIEGGDFEGFPLDFDSEEMSLKFRKLTKKLPKKLYKLVFYNVSITPSLLLSFLKDLKSSSLKVLGFYECPLFEDLHIEMIIEYVQDPNNALENLIINWCDFITENIINRARQYIKKVDFSDIEPHEMEFTAWLE